MSYRQAIIDGISALSLGTFAVSSELPWDAAGTPLYQKNYKVFYVDEPDSEETAVFNTLCGGSMPNLSDKTTTISVFVTVDAKNRPANYDSLVNSVQAVKNSTEIENVRSREVDVITTFNADALLTEFVFRFTELKVN